MYGKNFCNLKHLLNVFVTIMSTKLCNKATQANIKKILKGLETN